MFDITHSDTCSPSYPFGRPHVGHTLVEGTVGFGPDKVLWRSQRYHPRLRPQRRQRRQTVRSTDHWYEGMGYSSYWFAADDHVQNVQGQGWKCIASSSCYYFVRNPRKQKLTIVFFFFLLLLYLCPYLGLSVAPTITSYITRHVAHFPDNLIGIEYENNTQETRFANYLRQLFPSDVPIMTVAARALGKL